MTTQGKTELARRVAERLGMSGEDVYAVMSALEEEMGGEDHIVQIADKGGWFMKHPLSERFAGDLFDCPITARFEESPMLMALTLPAEHGLYKVTLDDRAGFKYERVSDAE